MSPPHHNSTIFSNPPPHGKPQTLLYPQCPGLNTARVRGVGRMDVARLSRALDSIAQTIMDGPEYLAEFWQKVLNDIAEKRGGRYWLCSGNVACLPLLKCEDAKDIRECCERMGGVPAYMQDNWLECRVGGETITIFDFEDIM